MVILFNIDTFEIITVYPDRSDSLKIKDNFQKEQTRNSFFLNVIYKAVEDYPYILPMKEDESQLCIIDIDKYEEHLLKGKSMDERIHGFVKFLKRDDSIKSILSD